MPCLGWLTTSALTHVKTAGGLLLFAGGIELLEVGPQVGALILAADAGKHHLGAGNLCARICDVLLEHRLIPGNARILVRLAVAVAFHGGGIGPPWALKPRTDQVFRAFADPMARQALFEPVLACG